jgi:hypothetical protein
MAWRTEKIRPSLPSLVSHTSRLMKRILSILKALLGILLSSLGSQAATMTPHHHTIHGPAAITIPHLINHG